MSFIIISIYSTKKLLHVILKVLAVILAVSEQDREGCSRCSVDDYDGHKNSDVGYFAVS